MVGGVEMGVWVGVCVEVWSGWWEVLDGCVGGCVRVSVVGGRC